MTDNEIIKALECCCKNNNCEGCPLDYLTFSSQCASELAIKSLDLINRQQEDIERLQSMNRAKLDTIHDLQADTNKLKEQLQNVTEKFNCQQTVYADLSKIIKNQKEEIVRLEYENEILSKNADTAFQDGLNEAQDLYAEQVKDEIKSEAIKEFAERLKKELGFGHYIQPDQIDNLVKEMVGEE